MIKSKKGDLKKRMQQRIDHQTGSGWTVKQIKGFVITTNTQKPSRGSSYIPTPEKLNNSKLGLVNIQNEDEQCFKWCMIYHQKEEKRKHSFNTEEIS